MRVEPARPATASGLEGPAVRAQERGETGAVLPVELIPPSRAAAAAVVSGMAVAGAASELAAAVAMAVVAEAVMDRVLAAARPSQP